MRRIEIKKWLLERGISQTEIARQAGVSDALVSLMIKGDRRGERVRLVLLEHGCPSELLGVTEDESKAV